jgi:hypothetical protein
LGGDYIDCNVKIIRSRWTRDQKCRN